MQPPKAVDVYADSGPERVGFVLKDGTIVEVQNIAPKPESAFEVSAADLRKYEDTMVASWHTHPGKGSNLSVDDWLAFKNWPSIQHFILGNDGVSVYEVRDNSVLRVGYAS